MLITQPFGHQPSGKRYKPRSILQTRNTASAVEIRTNSHMLHSHHVNHMHDVTDSVIHRGIFLLLIKETAVHAYLGNTAR